MISQLQYVVYLFHLVANIPYGSVGNRSTEGLILLNKGSCSSKHVLLAEMLKVVGIEVRYFMGKSDLRDLNEYLPMSLHVENSIIDYHNFLKVSVDGVWLTVDATFGQRELEKGLPTNIGWGGCKNCSILFPVSDSVEIQDIYTEKIAQISKLCEREKKLRGDYFTSLEEYLSN